MANSIHVKNAFSDALKRLMKKRSLDNITVKEIVEVSGFSHRTFYNYFKDKDDLLTWIFTSEVIALATDFGVEVNDFMEFATVQVHKMSPKEYAQYIAKRNQFLYKNRDFYISALSSKSQNSLWEFLVGITVIFYKNLIDMSIKQYGINITDIEKERLARFLAAGTTDQVSYNLKMASINKSSYFSLLEEGESLGKISLDLYLKSKISQG